MTRQSHSQGHNSPDPVATDAAAQEVQERDERIQSLEAALRVAEERATRAERVLDSMTDGVMIFDPSGRVVRMNAAAQALFAARTDEWNAAPSFDERKLRDPVYDEHDRSLTREQLPFARILRGEELAGANMMDVVYRGPSGQQARVSVQDQGPGLTHGEQQRIWERFHRVERITVKSGSGVGLGLGLYISRTIVERLGGQVGVQSVRGAGTTFFFTLPIAE